MALVNQFATLLNVGVVTTFQPSEAELVGVYLYYKVFISPDYETFPEIFIYGKNASPPWEIWKQYEQCRFPHQDFIYFFSPAEKINPNKARRCRRIGTDGKLGTWSETEPSKSIYVDGVQEAYGTLRKFRYEKKKNRNDKDEKENDISDEHHGGWLMDEFTINYAPDLALCRIKVNEKGGDRRNKRKNVEEAENLRSKKRKLEDTTSEQMPSSSSSSYFHQDDQVAPENNFSDELEKILMSDDDADENLLLSPIAILVNEAQLRACVAESIPNEKQPKEEQDSDYTEAPQQQLGPESSSSSQEDYKVQVPQQDQASSSDSNEQQLLAENNLILKIDFDSLESINQLLTDEDQPWWDFNVD